MDVNSDFRILYASVLVYTGRTPFYAVSVNGLHRDRLVVGLASGLGIGLGRVVRIRQAIY